MDRGLWAWTRHPNYFGDACVWWGLWLITINDRRAPLATVGSPLMTYLLVDVSGARLTERYLKGRLDMNIKGEQPISCPGHRDRRVGDDRLDHHGAGWR